MRQLQFANQATSKLAANIGASDLALSVLPGEGAKFPTLSGSQYFTATLVKASGTAEIVKVTARSGDTFTIVRAYEKVGNTQTAYAFTAGDRVELRLSAKALADELDRLKPSHSVLNKSADYTVAAADNGDLIRVDSGAADRIITLPLLSGLTDDFEVIIAKVTGDSNKVKIAASGANMINGLSTYELTSQYSSAWLIADRTGSTWTAVSSGAGANASIGGSDAFTGNGTANPLTLSAVPADKNATIFLIGGVPQYRSSYTLAGNTLTPSAPIPSGVPVEVWWLTAANVAALKAASVSYTPAGTGAVQRSVEAKLRDTVSVLDYYDPVADAGDYTAAIQRAHDNLPASGGTIRFPSVGVEYLLAVGGTYVNITKPNVTLLGDAGAWVVSPNSTDPEVKTGISYLNGFKITGTNCVVSVNMRGPAVAWYPGASGNDRLAARNMEFRNMYNSGIAISGATGFDLLDVDGVVFNTSRDLSSDAGNYEAISRGSASTSPKGRLVRVNRCLFRAVSGAIDVHNVTETVIGGGTRFEGCDIVCVKMSTLDVGRTTQNLTVDDTVTIDGTAINPLSANRHLSCSGGRTVNGYSMYIGFIQVFSNVQWHGRVANAPNIGVAFLDGSFTDAVLNFDRARFESVPNAIQDPQGTFSLLGAELIASNVNATSVSILRTANVKDCRMRDSYVALTTRCLQGQAKYEITSNQIDYSVDNLAPLRLVDYTVDNVPTVLIDKNIINLSGAGVTLAIAGGTGTTFNGGSGGTRAYIGPNNVLSAGATVQGRYLTAYEQATGTYTGNLYLPFRNGEMTVVNTNASGDIVYLLGDAASTLLPVGTVFHACRSGTADLYFSCTGGINGVNSARATSPYASATFRKMGPNKWQMTAVSGTWIMS